ncbi:MAG: adenosylcobinamide-phosphate synthase CbiB [Sphingobium sp.]
MAEPVALAALALDATLGWPKALYGLVGHPVGLFARVIGRCERAWNRPEHSEPLLRLLGVVTIAILHLLSGGGAWLLAVMIHRLFTDSGWIAVALLAWPALAQRSLYEHVRPIPAHLRAGDRKGARHAVSLIVGRDTAALDEAGIARAAIESLAESFCDGVVAPLFWLIVGGLPGIWAYKAINTADSLIGHYEPRWRAFGWAAARLDDLLNLIPARLGGVLLCLAGGGGWSALWRNHRKHASPNAGWTEAAMAGALGLRLGGPLCYDGVRQDKPWIGDGRADANARDVEQALGLYRRACLLLWVIAAGVALGFPV